MFEFLFAFWEALPWVAIALMAALALRRQKESKVLMMQAVGSGAMFVVGMARWVVDFLLRLCGVTAATSAGLMGAVHAVFGFLLFLSLATFALGFCLERFRRRGGSGEAVQVSARAVDG